MTIRSGDFYDWLTARCDIVGESDGNEVVAVCPWCGKDRLYANPDKAVFTCFRCRESGRAEYLIAKVEGCTLATARERLRDRTVPNEDDLTRMLGSLARNERDVDPPVLHPLPEDFVACYNPCRRREWKVPKYLGKLRFDGDKDRRGITDSMIIRHGLGYAREGRYRDRVIIPVIEGEHRTFLTRLMGSPRDFRWKDKGSGDWVVPPKYMTPRDAGLSRTLYGSSWVREGSDLIMVEGSFDVMRLTDLGFPACGVLGKRLSNVQATLIAALRPTAVTFLYDAGAHAEACQDADTLGRRLDPERCPVYVARMPEGTDPDSLGLTRGRSAIVDVLREREDAASGWSSLEAGILDLD